MLLHAGLAAAGKTSGGERSGAAMKRNDVAENSDMRTRISKKIARKVDGGVTVYRRAMLPKRNIGKHTTHSGRGKPV
jgi:hypothetical protein